jgi:hypothetical protein
MIPISKAGVPTISFIRKSRKFMKYSPCFMS